MEKRRNTGNVWPYVVAGSAVGGAVAYLFTTETGRKLRRSLAHPDELADTVENCREFIEDKARVVTDRVRGVIDRAKEGMEAGQRAFNEADAGYRTNIQGKLEGKNEEIAGNVHKAVDNVSRTASTLEQNILDPLYELGAIYRGVEKGIRTAFGRNRGGTRTPTPMYPEQRVSG